MKGLLFTLLLAVVAIPQLSNAQERLSESAPVDRRDIEDKPRLRELLKKLRVNDEDADRAVNAPRFRLAAKHAVEMDLDFLSLKHNTYRTLLQLGPMLLQPAL